MGTSIDRSALEILQTLQNEGEPDFLKNLVHLFLINLTERITEVTDAAGRNDLETLAKAAHTLKSSSLTMGAKQLGAICERMEKAAHAQQELAPILAELQMEEKSVREELRLFLRDSA